jgi:uncharacterized membrane protein YcaP (DUF421 family)
MTIDWQSLFVPQTSLLELVIRGTAVYLTLFVLLRFLIRRRVGAMSITDLLVIVLIADAAQNGMAGDYKSISEAIILCGTIIGWSLLLDWLAFHVAWLRDWLEPPPKQLIEEGRVLEQQLREELITVEELESQLRQHGVAEISTVRRAFVEPDGQFSVIKVQETLESDDHPRKGRGREIS